MTITREDVLHVARLARLELDDAETSHLMQDLRRILDYVQQLSELDTQDVVPTAQVSVERAPLRKDRVVPGVSRELALGQAPRTGDGGFAVPGFVED